MPQVDEKRNRYIRGLATKEARELLYNIVLENTGVEITKGATILKSDDSFDLGKKSVAIEIINSINNYCPGLMKKMKEEEDYYVR